MTVSTFYPDGDPETTSVDGSVVNNQGAGGVSWATLRDAASGTTANPSLAQVPVNMIAGNITDNFRIISRVFFLFLTSTLGDNDTIDAATLEFVVISGSRTDEWPSSAALVTSTPASNTDLVTGDYSQVGTVDQATDVTFASLTVDSATYNAMTLNATGRGNVSKTGITKFGLRETRDADNAPPTWVSLRAGEIEIATAEEVLAGDKRPKLVVTHTSPPFVPTVIVF